MEQDWTKQATFNFGWMPPVFVRLRVEKRLFSALQDKDSETGEVVVILVVNPHETANHAMMNIVP